MWIWLGLILTLSPTSWAMPDAQVLVTSRGEPAPFPHFPSVNAVPVNEDPASFQFAPTPTGRALEPNGPALVAIPAVPADVPQALGESLNFF